MTSPPPNPEDLRRLGPIVLVGHRGVGKSTLGEALARSLVATFTDLDQAITESTGKPPRSWLEESPEGFRQAERETLIHLCDAPGPSVIACGAGAWPLPPEAFVVWIARDGWQKTCAESDRPRVRPELTEDAEWEWMRVIREPRWNNAAHLKLQIPRGRSEARAARDLHTLISWSALVAHSPIAPRTFLVPTAPEDLPRALRDARRFGLAGVELRSDVFDDWPAELSDEPQARDVQDVSVLASLRHNDPTWLSRFTDADAWDVDLELAHLTSNTCKGSPPRQILSAHPDRLTPELIARLRESLQTGAYTDLKVAPLLPDLPAISEALELLPTLRTLSTATTLLPRSPRASWLRPVLAPDNHLNYLPLGISTRDPEHPSPLDLLALLPHLAGPRPTTYDVLLGDPVAGSQGDLWHRRESLQSDAVPTGYLKIPTPRGELTDTLELLTELPVRGVSITSPLKREAAQSPLVNNPDDLQALNTLSRPQEPNDPTGELFLGHDTDHIGLIAVLDYLEAHDIGPGRALILGRGGVSPALLRALHHHGWELAAHLSGRQGFLPQHRDIDALDLIINAAGPTHIAAQNVPPHRAWLDLHYNDVQPPPHAAALHLQGDLFFDAQAFAQRALWSPAASGPGFRPVGR